MEIAKEEAGERPVECIACGALVHWKLAEEEEPSTRTDRSRRYGSDARRDMVDVFERPLKSPPPVPVPNENLSVVDADETMDGETQALTVDEGMLLSEVEEFRSKQGASREAPEGQPVLPFERGGSRSCGLELPYWLLELGSGQVDWVQRVLQVRLTGNPKLLDCWRPENRILMRVR